MFQIAANRMTGQHEQTIISGKYVNKSKKLEMMKILIFKHELNK